MYKSKKPPFILKLYFFVTKYFGPFLSIVLQYRLIKGKEDKKRILEININHELVNKLKSLDKNQKEKFCEILYDHAKLMEGESLDDPKKYTNLVSELVSL